MAKQPTAPAKSMKLVRILAPGHEVVARTARSPFPLVGQASNEQTTWMLRSLLEE